MSCDLPKIPETNVEKAKVLAKTITDETICLRLLYNKCLCCHANSEYTCYEGKATDKTIMNCNSARFLGLKIYNIKTGKE